MSLNLCDILGPWEAGCRDEAGGVVQIGIAKYFPDTIYTFGPTFSEILTTSYATGSFHYFEQGIEQASATEEMGASNDTGTIGFTGAVNIILQRMDAESRHIFLTLARGRFRLLIKNKKGRWLLAGKDSGLMANAGNSGPGKAQLDLSGYSVTLQSIENEPFSIIDELEALRLMNYP